MYGFEVGNEKVLRDIGKRTTLAQARKTMEETHKNGIRSLGLFMLGLPSDTRESCLETIAFAQELNPDICKFNLAVPFPGSIFFEEFKKEVNNIDNLNDKFTSWYDWSSYDGRIIYSPKAMLKKELVNLQRKGMFSFYSRPQIIFKHLIHRTFSFVDLVYGAWVLTKNYLKALAK